MRLGQGLQALDPALPLFLHLPPALAMPQGLALTPVQTLPQGLALTPGLGTWLPQPQPANFLVGGWQAGFINPRTWGLGRRRSHEYVIGRGAPGSQTSCTIAGTLQAARQAFPSGQLCERTLLTACGPWRPGGWTGRQAGLREPHLLQAAAREVSQTPRQTRLGCNQRRPAHRSGLHLSQGTRMTGLRCSQAHWCLGAAWSVASKRSLDRSQRILAWRILHGKVRIGAFLRSSGPAWAKSDATEAPNRDRNVPDDLACESGVSERSGGTCWVACVQLSYWGRKRWCRLHGRQQLVRHHGTLGKFVKAVGGGHRPGRRHACEGGKIRGAAPASTQAGGPACLGCAAASRTGTLGGMSCGFEHELGQEPAHHHMASCASGQAAPDGHGHAGSMCLPARQLQCGTGKSHPLTLGSCSSGMFGHHHDGRGRAAQQRSPVPG